MNNLNIFDKTYVEALLEIENYGEIKHDRTGVGTRSLFGMQMRYDLNQGFPILTTKKVPFKLIASELLWFLKGDTSIRYLLQNNNHIWDEWGLKNLIDNENFEMYTILDIDDAKTFKQLYLKHGLNYRFKDEWFKEKYDIVMEDYTHKMISEDYNEDLHMSGQTYSEMFGNLGPVYGKQWRNFNGVDQIAEAINLIKNDPDSRRIVVNSWNPSEINQMALPPCHMMFQFYVSNNKLSCQLYQRSADMFLGVPFNISSYSLLTHIIAKECDLGVGDFIHTLGDAHIYLNHMDQVSEQLNRYFDGKSFAPPELKDFEKKPLNEYEVSDFVLDDYQSMPPIKAPVAV